MRWAETLTTGFSAYFFSKMAEKHKITLIGSIFEKDGNNYWDTAVIYNPTGKLAHYTRKVHIPSGGFFFILKMIINLFTFFYK